MEEAHLACWRAIVFWILDDIVRYISSTLCTMVERLFSRRQFGQMGDWLESNPASLYICILHVHSIMIYP